MALLLVLITAFVAKIRKAVRLVDDPSDRMLLKCSALACMAVAVCACFCCTLATEGLYFTTILLGAILGTARACTWGKEREEVSIARGDG